MSTTLLQATIDLTLPQATIELVTSVHELQNTPPKPTYSALPSGRRITLMNFETITLYRTVYYVYSATTRT
jgi:hypothetical protein